MEDHLKARNIVLSSFDRDRLQEVLISAKAFASKPSALFDSLEAELNRAKIVAPNEIPPYVVTMNSRGGVAALNRRLIAATPPAFLTRQRPTSKGGILENFLSARTCRFASLSNRPTATVAKRGGRST